MGKPFRMPVHSPSSGERQLALALYGALQLPDKRIVVQWSDAQPATQPTWAFLEQLVALHSDKRWLMLIWDNASFHRSQALMERIRQHNRTANTQGLPRIVPYRLPTGAPWLNPIEPHWLWAKRNIYSAEHPLTPELLRERVYEYFDQKNATIISDS